MSLRRTFVITWTFLCLTTAGTAAEPMHDAVKPVPRDGGWMKRHESFNERVKQGNVDLIFIGDSITQGWEGAGKQVWAKHYGERNAVNLGIGGDRTQHVLWRLDNGNIYGIQPKLAVIMIGTNNSGSNTSEQIAEGITAIVEKLRAKLPSTKILLLGIFPRGADKSDARRQVNEGANAIVAKLADGKMIEYLDIGPKFLAEDGTLSKEIMPDLLHLSPAGYQIWAEAIEDHVARMLKSTEEKLQSRIEVDFRRTPLQDAFAQIGQQTGVTFRLDGDALKSCGYTKNMAVAYRSPNGPVPALDVIKAIMGQFDQMALVIDEADGAAVVTSKAVAAR